MRDKLLNELLCIANDFGAPSEQLKSKLIIALDKYEVTQRTTEIAICSENDIEKYLKLFLLNKRVSGRTERTLIQYKTTLVRFFEEVRKSPLEITSDDIKLYLATKEIRDGVSKCYQNDILRVIGSFYTWMQREEYIARNPMNKVDKINIPKKRKKAFTEYEIEVMRNNLTTLRDKALFEVLLSTWCRVSEVEGMNISDIKNGDTIEVLGKGQKYRQVYFNPKAKLAIENYLASRTDKNDALFVSLDKPYSRIKKSGIEILIRKLGRKSGVENSHPHRFRRTGATLALRKGMPIELVSKILGHESIETTQIYLDISEREVENAHRKYMN